MTKKNNKTLTWIIGAVCAVAIIAVIAIVVTKNQNNTPAADNTSNTNNSSTTTVTADELQKTTPAVEVSYGDYDAMQTLSKDIQNGKMTGQIVSIDGLVNHPGTTYSVVEASTDGKTKIGTVFNIEDGDEYPADGAHITIVAKVVEVSPMNFQLVTLKNFVKEK